MVWAVNNTLERMWWKEAGRSSLRSYLGICLQRLRNSRRTSESRPGFEPRTSRIRNRNVAHPIATLKFYFPRSSDSRTMNLIPVHLMSKTIMHMAFSFTSWFWFVRDSVILRFTTVPPAGCAGPPASCRMLFVILTLGIGRTKREAGHFSCV
jgi:hypothetical protein